MNALHLAVVLFNLQLYFCTLSQSGKYILYYMLAAYLLYLEDKYRGG